MAGAPFEIAMLLFLVSPAVGLAQLVSGLFTRPRVEVAYVTDVEGNLAYFDRWVQHSRVVRYKRDEPDQLELTHEGAYFVYGGDVVDRGEGNVRLLQRLVALKRAYPTRVHLLAGNRDLNKLRLSAELSDSDLARPFATIPGPHWDTKAPTLAEYYEKLAAERPDVSIQSLDSRAERLRYYYKHTLGCPETFELRRSEIALIAGPDMQLSCNDHVTFLVALRARYEIEHAQQSNARDARDAMACQARARGRAIAYAASLVDSERTD